MKPHSEWDEAYVLNLPPGEFDWVEFKGARALDLTLSGVKEANVREELSRQLSAFSNSGGGALVYGIANPAAGSPLVVDGGGISLQCKASSTKEWLEDIIPNLVESSLKQFNVLPIESKPGGHIARGKAVFLISIPDSEQAPHQANDKRYYARIGGKSVPIGHRFVVDILGRSKHPKMGVRFAFVRETNGDALELKAWCENTARVFANYVNGELLLPLDCIPSTEHEEDRIVSRDGWRYHRFVFDNVHKDVVGINTQAMQAFTVSRYDPVLPTQAFHIPLRIKFSSLLKKHDLADKEIIWRVYADNAPVQTERIAIRSIKVVDP